LVWNCINIVDEYKVGVNNSALDSFRELILEARTLGMTAAHIASFFRLYNFFRGSGQRKMKLSHSLPILILVIFSRAKQLI
jgi:hypothetical protein